MSKSSCGPGADLVPREDRGTDLGFGEFVAEVREPDDLVALADGVVIVASHTFWFVVGWAIRRRHIAGVAGGRGGKPGRPSASSDRPNAGRSRNRRFSWAKRGEARLKTDFPGPKPDFLWFGTLHPPKGAHFPRQVRHFLPLGAFFLPLGAYFLRRQEHFPGRVQPHLRFRRHFLRKLCPHPRRRKENFCRQKRHPPQQMQPSPLEAKVFRK